MKSKRTVRHQTVSRSYKRTSREPPVARVKMESSISTVDELLNRERYQKTCDVKIKQDNSWFILSGHVDSHGTKAKLFGLMPKVNGEQRIVDRLKVKNTSAQKRAF